jgi:hypothetical protein
MMSARRAASSWVVVVVGVFTAAIAFAFLLDRFKLKLFRRFGIT